jgi:hypothetical protein
VTRFKGHGLVGARDWATYANGVSHGIAPYAVSNTPPGSQWATFAMMRLFSTGLRGLGYVGHVDGVDAICRLATNAESTDQSAVALDIAALHVIEQTATLANEFH